MERLPGFRDFYPEPLPHTDTWSADARQFIFDKWRETAKRYNFREYDGPPLEPLELFTTKSGEEIVGQLYNFTDKGERAISLRPEMTPTLARMVAAHERNYKKPIKWFALPQLFRYERQQKGRLREHFQFNADIIGESDPSADAELIALLIDTLRAFGLTEQDFVIRLSSRNAWQEFYKMGSTRVSRVESGVSPDSPSFRRDAENHTSEACAPQNDSANEYNFFQIIDKLERTPPEESEKKLSALGFSLADVNQFIESGKPTAELENILQNLAARGLGSFVKIDYRVIRGLAYYTGVVFEAFDAKGEFRAIAGGGRYDNLVKLISGGKVNLPALGFGMGDVVLLEILKARGLLPKFDANVDVFVLIEDETLRAPSLKLIQELRASGFAVEYPLTPAKPDKQFKRAQELKAAFTAKVESESYVRIRNLKSRDEIVAGFADAANHLR
ncbi:MAG TPA: histidine--tRNA ligase [Verrucomicrobiae bacterium]|nr:histidine--tRNA ligase [Verrucomicrobiae bacterium]